MRTNASINFSLALALTPALSPGESEQTLSGFGFANNRSEEFSRRCFSKPENDSPSPWGEGRDEGGRASNSSLSRVKRLSSTEKFVLTLALTPALSPGEREKQSSGFAYTEDFRPVAALSRAKSRRTILPLPGGEGQGEGEPNTILFGLR